MFRIAQLTSFCIVLLAAPLLGAQSNQAAATKANLAQIAGGD